MKKIILSFSLAVSLFAVDYSTLRSGNSSNYENSVVDIHGKFLSYRCTKDRRVNGNRVDGYCKVQLKAMDNDEFIGYVALYVGTTWESDFKSASRNDMFSFSCTYKNNLSVFRDCR